jgi:hypothetical protein
MMSAAPARNAHTAPPLVLGVISIVWLVVAWWLYQPFSPRPYDVADFPFFVPLLRQSSSLLEAFSAVASYYADHGRLNLGAFVLLVGRWSLFRDAMMGWQVTRFIEMTIIAWMLYWVLRRLGISWIAALAGPVIVLVSPSAAVAWMRLSIAEPPATILLLLLMLVLLRGGTKPMWTQLAAVAALVILIGLTKEAILATVIVPALLLGRVADHPRAPGWGPLLRDPRLWTVAAACLAVSIPIVLVALQAPEDAFSRSYGGSELGAARFALPIAVTLLPFSPNHVPLNLMLATNVLYALLLVIGWAIVMKPGGRTPRAGAVLGLGVGMALAGAAIYAPWARYSPLYAFPFQVGTAVLVAVAVGALAKGRLASLALAVLCAFALLPVLSSAYRYTRFVRASLETSRTIAEYLNELSPTLDVRLQICGLERAQWTDYGKIVQQYAVSLGGTPPRVVDADCHEQSTGPRVVLSNHTQPLPPGGRAVIHTHGRFDWSTIRATRDTLALAFLPAASNAHMIVSGRP